MFETHSQCAPKYAPYSSPEPAYIRLYWHMAVGLSRKKPSCGAGIQEQNTGVMRKHQVFSSLCDTGFCQKIDSRCWGCEDRKNAGQGGIDSAESEEIYQNLQNLENHVS